MVVAAAEMVVVVEVVESEAEETDVADGGGSRTMEAGAGCLVLWVTRRRLRVRALADCERCPCCSACVPVPGLWVVSCVARGGVVALCPLRV